MIFLDSDILSYYFLGNTKIRDKIMETLRNKEQIALTIINVYEVLKGFRWRKNIKKETMFINFLETIPVFAIDNDVTTLAADIYADLRITGKIISDADILIAAIIIKNNGKLVTNNTGHFINISGINLINWLQ
jgi:predicted nucleic acid-binding protein